MTVPVKIKECELDVDGESVGRGSMPMNLAEENVQRGWIIYLY